MTSDFLADLPRPLLALAPMAGYTESCFRRLVREIEPSTVLVSELVSAEAVRHGNEKTRRLMSFSPEEKHYYGVQLFGHQLEAFVDAARVVEDMNADFIDLNLGCPSPKVIGSGHGSALLKSPLQTAKLIEALVQATKLPVTVKMRLGFYDDERTISTAQDFANAGISMLSIHGRTTTQKFRGQANWEKIYQVKEALPNLIVLGNGDITSATIAKNYLKNLDGVMIGQAALRNPWIFRQCRQIFSNQVVDPKPPIKEQLDFFRRHANLAIRDKDEQWAMIELRKHFSHFVRGFRGASQFREKLIRVNSMAELETIFHEMEKELAI